MYICRLMGIILLIYAVIIPITTIIFRTYFSQDAVTLDIRLFVAINNIIRMVFALQNLINQLIIMRFK